MFRRATSGREALQHECHDALDPKRGAERVEASQPGYLNPGVRSRGLLEGPG